jgi:hypothetical protein
MNRRHFIQVVGGGTIAAATATIAPAALANMPKAAIGDWDGPNAAEKDVRRWALGYAILAPNPHNMQPWIVDLAEPNVITLYCDRTRLLPETDPLGRQILVGHGCFLELLRIALAERGFAAQINVFPQGAFGASLKEFDAQRPVARITLAPSATKDPLFGAILRRHTSKDPFDTARPIAPATLAALEAEMRSSSAVTFGAMVEAARMQPLRVLVREAGRIEAETERTMMESVRLIRVGPDEITRHRDGISLNSAFVRFATAVGMFDRSTFPKPGSTGHKQTLSRYDTFASTATGFVWLSTAGNSRAQQVAAGRAFVRLHLRATDVGLALHPLSQALQEFPEMRGPYTQIHSALVGKVPQAEGDAVVQMFCRIGYPKVPVTPSPRRGVAALLRA